MKEQIYPVTLKTKEEIEKMRKAGRIASEAMALVARLVRKRMTPIKLERKIERFVAKKRRARLAFKDYRQFPAGICVSVNDAVVHGIPDERKFQKGDIVSVDLGVEFECYYADIASTFVIGRVDDDVLRLIKGTRIALSNAIQKARVGNMLSEVSKAIEQTAADFRLGVVKDYCGHGIGTHIHESPRVHNYYCPEDDDLILREGMTIAIEPMLTLGSGEVYVDDKDLWTVRTKDKVLAAHFEHTIAVTNYFPEILTRRRMRFNGVQNKEE